jgi:hypothetical protein
VVLVFGARVSWMGVAFCGDFGLCFSQLIFVDLIVWPSVCGLSEALPALQIKKNALVHVFFFLFQDGR